MQDPTAEDVSLNVDRLIGRFTRQIGQATLEAEIATARVEERDAQIVELRQVIDALEARITELEHPDQSDEEDPRADPHA